jgi:hypothetical protein
MRSTTLWALSQAGSQAWPELVLRVAEADSNLSGIARPTPSTDLSRPQPDDSRVA